MRCHPHPVACAILVAALAVTRAAAEPIWPQWRGPAGAGHAPAALGRAIFLRTKTALYRLEKPKESGR